MIDAATMQGLVNVEIRARSQFFGDETLGACAQALLDIVAADDEVIAEVGDAVAFGLEAVQLFLGHRLHEDLSRLAQRQVVERDGDDRRELVAAFDRDVRQLNPAS